MYCDGEPIPIGKYGEQSSISVMKEKIPEMEENSNNSSDNTQRFLSVYNRHVFIVNGKKAHTLNAGSHVQIGSIGVLCHKHNETQKKNTIGGFLYDTRDQIRQSRQNHNMEIKKLYSVYNRHHNTTTPERRVCKHGGNSL